MAQHNIFVHNALTCLITEAMNTTPEIVKTELLSDNWYILKKVTYSYMRNGVVITQAREAYDRGNGAAILLYNTAQRTVILTRQFRLPTFINGNPTGMMTEVCAGLLDNDDPEACIRRETEEETGYKLARVQKVFEAYMSPGSVTEVLHFFIAEYTRDMKVSGGGGLDEEDENIEVLEYSIDEAMQLVYTGGIKDAKTIMLLQYIKLQGLL